MTIETPPAIRKFEAARLDAHVAVRLATSDEAVQRALDGMER